MVRASKILDFDHRPTDHFGDDVALFNQFPSPREKRQFAVRPTNLQPPVKSCKPLIGLGGLGAKFKRLADGCEAKRRLPKLTPRATTGLPQQTPSTLTRAIHANGQRNKNRSVKNCVEKLGPGGDASSVRQSRTATDLIPDSRNILDAAHSDAESSVAGNDNFDDACAEVLEKSASCESNFATGHGVDPKFMTKQVFRSRVSDDTSDMAEQLREVGKVCTPLCSPRRLDKRRQKRAQKRITQKLQEKARPPVAFLHPPCLVSGSIYSLLAVQYKELYESNLRQLYNEQLKKEVSVGKSANV